MEAGARERERDWKEDKVGERKRGLYKGKEEEDMALCLLLWKNQMGTARQWHCTDRPRQTDKDYPA